MIKGILRSLRRNSTAAERNFWQLVRNRKVNGKKFVRQYPIECVIDNRKRIFIADFYCHEHRLAIELDGEIHQNQKEYDALRTYIINRLGIGVIRFTNDEVKFEEDMVIEKLMKELI